ncbi:MAG: exodeoxyribonuclease VII small subunit [Bacteroidota bacterium]
MAKKKEVSYSEAISEVEGIVAKIENAEPEIDELADMVKRAAELVKICKGKLRTTQQNLDQSLEDLE